MILTFINLPKVSLNEWYAGNHWTKRKQLKDTYKLLIQSQLPRPNLCLYGKKYIVSYFFYFKNNPLDASNCVAMVKMIEDVLFKTDKWDVVISITIASEKSTHDHVNITIQEI